MNRNVRIYTIINIFFVITTIIVCVFKYGGIQLFRQSGSIQDMFILAGTAGFVHTIKAFRLYFELYEQHVEKKNYLKQYCKVLPVSMVLPFKIGDVFRAYCFGYLIKNYLVGCAVIILDRFIDTLALVFVMFTVLVVTGNDMSILFYLLIVFLMMLILIYLVFPGMCTYWKNYFLQTRATEKSLKILKSLKKAELAYTELAIVIKGKFLIIFLLSVAAWVAELGGIILSDCMIGESKVMAVTEYLTGIMFGRKILYLSQFICISVIMMLFLYFIIRVLLLVKKRVENE